MGNLSNMSGSIGKGLNEDIKQNDKFETKDVDLKYIKATLEEVGLNLYYQLELLQGVYADKQTKEVYDSMVLLEASIKALQK